MSDLGVEELMLKPYPAYKDSGVEWLGQVPEHWEVLPNRALFVESKECGYPDEPMLSVTITQGVIRQTALLSDSSKKDSSREDKSAYKLVHTGDIAYNKMRAWQGAIGASDFQGIVSPAYIVQRSRRAGCPRYYHYFFRAAAFAKEAERWSYGIASDMWSLRPEHFKLIKSCVPPIQEQKAIVRYLDYMDRRIRRYIRAKQKLIKLLEEQKQVIIHEAVTGQIDVRTGKPYPAYKDSGVEWLGQVPEHWMVRRIKDVARLKSGDGITSADIEPVGAYAVYGGNGVRGFTSQYTHDGDFVLIGRQGALCGNINYASGRFWASEHAVVAHPRGEFNLVWFGELLRTMNLNQYSIAAAQPGLAVERIQDLSLPVPPVEEQTRIGRYLDIFASETNEAVQCARRGIDLLCEYRTRLIADVVTGKLDVREVAANLRDEAEEPESLTNEDLLADEDEVEEAVAEEACPEELDA